MLLIFKAPWYAKLYLSLIPRPWGPEALESCWWKSHARLWLPGGLFSWLELVSSVPRVSEFLRKAWAGLQEPNWDSWFAKALGAWYIYIFYMKLIVTHIIFVSHYTFHTLVDSFFFFFFYYKLEALQVAQKTGGWGHCWWAWRFLPCTQLSPSEPWPLEQMGCFIPLLKGGYNLNSQAFWVLRLWGKQTIQKLYDFFLSFTFWRVIVIHDGGGDEMLGPFYLLIFKFFKYLFLLCVHAYMLVCIQTSLDSEDNFQGNWFSFHHAGLRDQESSGCRALE